MLKIYVAIGHFKGSKNIKSIAYAQNTRKAFMQDCYGNEFVPYVILTEKMLARVAAANALLDIHELVKKMTTHSYAQNDVVDYLEQNMSRIEEQVKAARKELEDELGGKNDD